MTENCCTNLAHNKQFAYGYSNEGGLSLLGVWEEGAVGYQWEAELQLLDVTETNKGEGTAFPPLGSSPAQAN